MTSSQELLLNTLQQWADLYGRKLTAKATEAWFKIFLNTKPALLGKALTEVTKRAERMPTPGLLTKAIQDMYDRYPDFTAGVEFRFGDPSCKICHGTGFKVVLFGEHSKKADRCECWKEQPQEYRSERVHTQDKNGVACVLDGKTGDVLYRAKDCEEGMDFVSLVRRLAKVKAIPSTKSLKALKQERNRQVTQLKEFHA